MYRRAAALTFTFVFASASLHAAQRDASSDMARPISAAIARSTADAGTGASLWSLSQVPKRPPVLPVLYGTYAALQVMDVVSTRKALAAGAREANPVMSGGNIGATVALKAASGAATFYVVEKTWKKHRAGAIMLMAIMNGTSAAIVAHNNRNAARR
jgi:hypothetical protein